MSRSQLLLRWLAISTTLLVSPKGWVLIMKSGWMYPVMSGTGPKGVATWKTCAGTQTKEKEVMKVLPGRRAMQFGGRPRFSRISALLLALSWSMLTSGILQAEAGAVAAPVSEDQVAATRPRGEVWLCAGDRIIELCSPDAEWQFVKQHLTGIKFYVGQLTRSRRQSGGDTSEQLKQLVRLVRDNNLQVAVELGGCLSAVLPPSRMDAVSCRGTSAPICGRNRLSSELAAAMIRFSDEGALLYFDSFNLWEKHQ